MDKSTTKKEIIIYLEQFHGKSFCYGGKLARDVHGITGTKESVVERRCRELVFAGILEKQLVQIDGQGPRVVQYRVKPLEAYSARPENGIDYTADNIYDAIRRPDLKPELSTDSVVQSLKL